MRFPGFVGPAYTSQSYDADAERLMNWYVEKLESNGGKGSTALYPTPGLKVFTVLPQGPVRAMLTQNNRTWVVGGTGAYEIFANGDIKLLGTMVQDGFPATISTNGPAGHQVFITSGGHGYIYDINSGAFTEATSIASWANLGAFLDGYFLALDTNTATLYTSQLENGLVWSGAAQRSTSGDKWVSMLVSHRDLWLFGSQRTDVWRTTPGSFALGPIEGAFIEQGIAAPYAVAELDNAPVWLGASENGAGIVWRANGYRPDRISTHAVEFAIQCYPTVSDAVAFTYEDQGHSFFVLNFPSAKATWVYDAATDLWHQRGAWLPNLQVYDTYRPQYHCFAFNKHLVGDRLNGTIYHMSINDPTGEDGEGIRRQRRTPYITDELKQTRFFSLDIDLEVGLGTLTGQGASPQVMLRFSNTQAKTWSNEIWASAGPQGAFRQRVCFYRLGQGRNRVYELTVTDPIPWRVVDAYFTAKGARY